MHDGALVTSGGRILSVTGLGATVPEARARAYEAVELVRFDGARYRRDIAVGWPAGCRSAMNAARLGSRKSVHGLHGASTFVAFAGIGLVLWLGAGARRQPRCRRFGARRDGDGRAEVPDVAEPAVGGRAGVAGPTARGLRRRLQRAIAPRGSKCSVQEAVDGSDMMLVEPRGKDSTAEVRSWSIPACVGCMFDAVCAYFPREATAVSVGLPASRARPACGRRGSRARSCGSAPSAARRSRSSSSSRAARTAGRGVTRARARPASATRYSPTGGASKH